MSATRLLVLGLARSHGRTHGYRLGTELYSIGADEWANVKWGSIYHALKQLTKKGWLAAFDGEVGDSGQCRTEYEVTPEGEEEFFRLLRVTVRTPEPQVDLRAAAIAFLPALTRDDAIALLETRVARLRETREELEPHYAVDDAEVRLSPDLRAAGTPSIVGELFGMWSHVTASEIEWTRGLVARLRSGAHTMAGEDPTAWGMPDLADSSPSGGD
ncbi:PadR family transcriptional regulator [Spiractinospora alimapuensis]|uniref:PadR family transcriptional regulator n=1 Tax=Spiractinospora alimapuensis TaxID=2820884 RepID=UPI001F4081E2|nr:PadR family transcriptional regulator [Spiractinospora alimapuensis]QVQ52549.1 PadR family transcriptional regulator [Spiractinospora alimapuensis]